MDVSKRLRTIEYNGCAAYVARSGGRTPVMELLCMWPRMADLRKDTEQFLMDRAGAQRKLFRPFQRVRGPESECRKRCASALNSASLVVF